jgi:hypothetical protein
MTHHEFGETSWRAIVRAISAASPLSRAGPTFRLAIRFFVIRLVSSEKDRSSLIEGITG